MIQLTQNEVNYGSNSSRKYGKWSPQWKQKNWAIANLSGHRILARFFSSPPLLFWRAGTIRYSKCVKYGWVYPEIGVVGIEKVNITRRIFLGP